MDKINVCSGFFDLNIQYEKKSIKKTIAAAKQRKLSRLFYFGYNVVAINTYVEELVFEPKKKKKKGETREVIDVVPAPCNLEDFDDLSKEIKILNRLTVEFSDSLQAHKLAQSGNYKKYDLIAVIPTSQNALQYACSSLDADIISFDPTNRQQLRLNRKMYTMAVERGLFFELMYAPAIKDSTARRNIISLSHMYHAIGKSKSVFVTSNGAEPYDLRGPYDVMNLCLILGLNEEKAKDAISAVSRSLYVNSVGRRCGKAVVWVSKVTSDSDSSSMDEEMECSSTNNRKSTSESPLIRSRSEEKSSYGDKTFSTTLKEKTLEIKPSKRPRTGSPDNEDGSS